MAVLPSRGEIWLADLDPTTGHEQGGRRPVLIISHDIFTQGPANLCIVTPLTTTNREIPTHIPISPNEGGVRKESYIMTEMIRSISKNRLINRWGTVNSTTMSAVEDAVRILLCL